ncbi:MAG: orotate phosphoribosyltransferase [Elusimicrobia bacterium]|nr:orotate phosphoribosyltransferase [Elusimicrobiota bacterium]
MSPDLEKVFKDTGALLEGHFQLSSGLHGDRYMQCALVLSYPDAAQELGRALAARCPEKPSVVISPALGGVVIGQEVARALGCRALFTERDKGGAMVLRRGFALSPGQTAAVVEDVVTTGKSTREVMDVVKAAGAKAVAALAVVDRSAGASAGLGAPFASLLKMDLKTWTAEECPLCREKKPLVKPGSRPGPGAKT